MCRVQLYVIVIEWNVFIQKRSINQTTLHHNENTSNDFDYNETTKIKRLSIELKEVDITSSLTDS